MSENTDPQPPPSSWEPRQWPSEAAPSIPPGYAQPRYEQPPFAEPYPPPPPYRPGPGYAMAPAAPYAGDTSTAAMAHWLPILVGFWGPLIIMMTTGTHDRYVRDNAVESLNFSLTLMIVYLVAGALGVFCMVTWIAFAVVPIGALVVHIMAATATSRGEQYRYPLNIRMVH